MRTVLVTGGAVRIGRAIVERLAAEGYAVAIHCHRSTEEAHALSRGLRAKGARVEVVVADLGDPATLGGLVRDARAALGPLALLVNNASAFEPDDIHSLDAALWERHFRINLGAPVFLARDFAAQVPEGAGGAVVNVIDQRVWKPTPQFFSYTLSKSALFTATQTLAQALAPRIRVNAVGPGPTLASRRQGRDDFLRQGASVPLGHGPRPEEIADAVLFLASARSITGQMLAVDGGQHLAWETPDVLAAAE
ncbi:MAG: short chain dehydrogenase [Microvirga sp.]|jgi:NAD(P)-dependent dehydrogenase (short-subunit alcohol dehydrogenase family)|nr:short chain dehydrogenase [Microvirga sp.]MCE3246718.1 short chain dehydrogenase [Geminicoccaceae bacterium]MDF2764535.1 short chain dehydrogenase [Rhodospirillales bacterium]MDF2969653.1 short chain dehydrogenase [Microvirga sp.]